MKNPNSTPAPSVTLTEPYHLLLHHGLTQQQRTHLGGYQTHSAAEAGLSEVKGKAAAYLGNSESYRFTIVPGPVTLAPHEQSYGGPWDKN
jgi:hypothetical protein